MRPKGYRPRLIEPRLDSLIDAFGCVEITGPKWCGKTWTALTRSKSATHLDNPQDKQAAELDPTLALLGDTPHLVDEWQEVPAVWDATRRVVDERANQSGQFILTGSSGLSSNQMKQLHHSGTGRIAKITMLPMTLAESGDGNAQISLAKLFEGEFSPLRYETPIQDIATWCCRGGWPANLNLNNDAAQETAIQYVQSSIAFNQQPEGIDPQFALALMRALAFNTGQAVTHKTLIKDLSALPDATSIEAPESRQTIAKYLELLTRLHLIYSLTGWEPPLRAKSRVRVKPKYYFCDPSLAAALLDATPDALLHDTQTFGLLFETLVLRDLRVMLSCYSGLGNTIHYYRDQAGLEADFIIQKGLQWAAIEVKLSDTKVDEAAKNLLRLSSKLTSNTAAKTPTPAFMAVIVGKSTLAYRRPDGIYVLPASALTA